MSMLWRIIISLLATGAAVPVAIISGRRRTAPGAAGLLFFALVLAFWGITYPLFWVGMDGIGTVVWGVASLGMALAPTALLAFALEYTRRGNLLTWGNLALLAIEPLVIQVLLWTGKGLPGFSWFWVNYIYSDCLLLITILILFQLCISMPRPYRLRLGILLAGLFAPVLISIASLAHVNPFPVINLTPIAFTITGIVLVYGLFRYHVLDVIPLARDIIVEKMNDGWMVIDVHDQIIDLNPAAEKLVGLSRDEIIGQPAKKVLSNWQNLNNFNARDLDVKRSMNLENEWRYLNMRLSPLLKNGHVIGKLIVWRDITERRKADEYRQRARNEMFILLQTISSSASRAAKVEDFLAEAIYQIVYAFQSQSSAIFLLEEREGEVKGHELSLAACHGLSKESVGKITLIADAADIINWVLEQQEPLLISEMNTDPRLSQYMQQSGYKTMLIVPMVVEGKTLGMISLMRTEGSAYSAEEIARLTAVTDEIASLIHNDRQRQFAIALTERQRLVRDLHDSVTARLYGLLTLTEAAQAGLEAGVADMPAQVLSRIGENARQALKEMRLFLYELQPIELERDGLVSVLNQRLAAVEGRADIKARLLVDEKVSLPLHTEVALYFIAQEAMNNVLRHANAKSVTIRLRQTKVNLRLEIEDDGCGFDPRVADLGGMGLRNMRERASLDGGKLKLVSAPGAGTKITVTIRKHSNGQRNRR